MLIDRIKIKKEVIFVSVGTLIVLWQILLPGYVLTLDMVWGENLNFINDSVFNLLPFNYLLYFLNFILPSWLIQKLFLITLFFCLFYLPYRFFPFDSCGSTLIDNRSTLITKYWFALFFVFNPFVYERFLAGHWSILLAYAFLAPFFYFLLKSNSRYDYRLAVWLALISLFSLHLLAMAFFIILIHFLFKLFRQLNPKHFLFFNLFDAAHWQAFKTSGFIAGGSLLSVIMLYGFWAESYPWANYFIWPKLFIIVPVFVLIAGLIIFGIRYAFKYIGQEKTFFLTILIFSIIFSAGVGEGIFKNLNLWLFEHIPFWSGFRDTTKWNSVIVFIYGLFGALGASFVVEKIQNILEKSTHNFILVTIFLLPLIYTYPMLGGFARQIKPVWYPESWHQVNNILKQDKDCKALFLPWHLYYSLSFNNNLVTANPASKFFDCEIISSQNIEIGDMAVLPPPDSIEDVKKFGIKYIIFSQDLVGQDIYNYDFLESENLEIKFSTVDLVLFQIRDRI